MINREDNRRALISKRDASVIVFAFLLAGVLRALVAYHGGIWADEGSFLEVIAAPSWSGMIEFLRHHESHPPLFYILMRAWARVSGGSDVALMLMPVLLGAAIVPAMYFAGSMLFSRSAGLVAAFLGMFSGPLTEHASQIRPYGLLAVLVAISCSSLAVLMTARGLKARLTYVVSTALLLYTHNWGWVIGVGQCAAVLVTMISLSKDGRRVAIREWLMSWTLIILLYTPWFSTLVYQTGHAGHGSLAIDEIGEVVGYAVFSIYRIIETTVLGHLGDRHSEAVAISIVATTALLFLTRSFNSKGQTSASEIGDGVERLRFRLLLFAGGFSLLAALILSPRSNLLLPRCISTVIPLMLLCLGYSLSRVFKRRMTLWRAQMTIVGSTVLIVSSMFELHALAHTSRSNVREIARGIRDNMRPHDMLVVAPEWFAASFDHYFPPSIEQVNHPTGGRLAMIDFANVWESRQNSTALAQLDARLQIARRDGRRVWFVVERRYLRKFTDQQIDKAIRHHQPAVYSVADVLHIRDTLTALYGAADATYRTKGPAPIHDEHLAYLFVPKLPYRETR